MSRFGVVRLAGAALIAVSATLALTAGGASASNQSADPDPGDARAIAHSGNATTCAGAGLTGTTISGGFLEGHGYAAQSDDRTRVTVSTLPPDVVLTAIVVKGGDNYNVYQPGQRGLGASLPYSALHSPINGGGNIPAVSHWFACSTTAASTGSNSPPATCASSGTSGGDNGPTCAPSPAGSPTTPGDRAVDAATPPAPGGQAGDLANTGFDPLLPTLLAVLLLLLGGLMIVRPDRVAELLTRLRRH